MANEGDKKNIFIGKTLRIFISYSHKDKKIAGAIKEAFNYYGMEAFLAHEDIKVGQEWIDVILTNLKQFDVFVAVLSKNFFESEWTNQEVGFAICKGTIVVPISIDGTIPSGFLRIFQALTKFEYKEYQKSYFDKEIILDCKESIFDVIKIISANPDFRENIKDSLIRGLTNLWSYRTAEKHLALLNELQPFSSEQINEIINQSLNNRQIYEASQCKTILKQMLEEYNPIIEKENFKILDTLINI